MGDYVDLKAKAVAAFEGAEWNPNCSHMIENTMRDSAFREAATPEVVLALLAEHERYAVLYRAAEDENRDLLAPALKASADDFKEEE